MLLGRATEQQRVEQLLAGARVGHSGTLLITGDPGIGKTALLDDAAARAHGLCVLRADGNPAESDVAFGGLLQLLRPALGLLEQIPGPQAAALGAALALRAAAGGDRFAVGAATLSLLCRFAEQRPVVVLVDDLPRLDQPSVEALLFAGRRLMADPVAFLATARSTELDDALAALPQLPLTGVDAGTAALLVASRLPAAGSPRTVDRLYRATAGNPLGLLELAGDPPALETISPEAPLPLPETLARAFAGRIRRLPDGTRTALLVAAVGGSDLSVVARAGQSIGVDIDLLADAEDVGLVRVTDGRVEFRHPLMRSVAYTDAAPARRRSVHRAVADALPGTDDDRRAWHLAESVLGPDDSVALLLEQAGARAAGRGAHAVAAAGYERAARLSADQRTRLPRLVAAAEAGWLAGDPDRAARLLDEAAELRPTGEQRTRLQALRGAVAARTGSLVESRDILAAAAADTADPDQSILLLADAVNACQYLGDAASALRLAERVEATLPGARTVRARGVGAIAAGMGRIFAASGGPEQIRQGVELLAGSPGPEDDERRLDWLLLGLLWLRDSDTGADLGRLVSQARARAAVGRLPYLLFHLGRDEATTRRWASAESTYSEGIRLARETGQSTELAVSLAGLAWLQGRQGRDEECRRNAEEAMQICVQRHIHLGRAWLLFALGELELGRGDAAAALTRLSELAGELRTLGLGDPDVSPAPEIVEALLRLDRRAEARQVADDFRSAATAKGQPWALARAQRALGLSASDSELGRHFRAALDLHAHTLDAYETARTELAYGARLRRARRRVDARAPLRAALSTFEELGAVPWAALAAAELAATGERVRRRAGAADDALTPQERQIAALLGEGRTTREAAAALFLSPKTVEYHLRKVYTKLGIRSRAELAERLRP